MNTTPPTDKRDEAYKRGDLVKKKGDKGQWHGRIVGEYSASCTPEGYAVESLLEAGSVQIYPASALEPWDGHTITSSPPQEVLKAAVEGLRKPETADEYQKYFDEYKRSMAFNAALDAVLRLIDGRE